MSQDTVATPVNPSTKPQEKLDYTLVGTSAISAVEQGLAEADWYQCYVPRETMRKLLERRDGPALRDCAIWFALIIGFATATCLLWGTWYAIIPYICYSVIYASSSDSRWHESSHGTAFKTDWMNNALYEIASFMVMRESVIWRWSHNRHHSDTIIVGRDPEIAVPRPPDIKGMMLGFLFNYPVYKKYYKYIILHSFGRMMPEEKTFVPESQYSKVFWRARLYVSIYLAVIALAVWMHSILPLLLVGLPNVFGSWLMYIYGYTQHAGLAENVLDHRLNCRTIYMNWINRYLYWNMNYHLEHHMFPLVPYHRLPELHTLVKDDCPVPYPSIYAAYREIISTVWKQKTDWGHYVKRKLPEPKPRHDKAPTSFGDAKPDAKGWIEVCAGADLGPANVIRFDHGKKSYALIRDAAGKLYATDGFCTHGNTHLSDGLVKDDIIECPKHNGRFHLVDGSPARAPICRGLVTYPLEERQGRLYLNLTSKDGPSVCPPKTFHLRVVSNRSVSTFIKELVLEPVDPAEKLAFTPGDYIQLDIPAYDTIKFSDFDIPGPYAQVWRNQHLFDLVVHNPGSTRRNNYSLASNQQTERTLRFNVRISTPPPGQDCPPGVGSSYVFSLKPGDTVSAIGPFGDFHIKPTKREMIYIGGGAGMAPLRAHLCHLLETENTARRISFWYGARSKQEIFYADYLESLADKHSNFSFHLALSSPLPEDQWNGLTGFIHEVVLENHLRNHPNPKAAEYYLCGPPMMIKACLKMLADAGVSPLQIAYDEF